MQIYTIGYEGLDQSRFIRVLKSNGIELLADVRAMPLSRKKGFSKTPLQALLGEHGIGYVHAKAFGCPNSIRDHYKVHKDWNWYTVHFLQHLKNLDAPIEEFISTLAPKRCALMCFEADYRYCHRHFIAQRMAELRDGLKVIHLTGKDWIMPQSYAAPNNVPCALAL